MLKKFYPNLYINSTYKIDFSGLYNNGYRGIIFDVDNTLVPHGLPATKESISLCKKLKEIGFDICLLSNNKEKRVLPFAKAMNVKYIANGHKPSIKKYIEAMDIMGTNKKNTLFIGDQIFTDVYGANRAGIFSILVKPIDKKEEIQIVLKRYIERIVLFFYKRQGIK